MFVDNYRVRGKLLGSKKEVTGYVVKTCTGRCLVIDGKDEFFEKSIHSHSGYQFITHGVYEVDESTVEFINK